MNEDRGPWYLVTGLVIGVVLGLVYSLRIDPVVFESTAPISLRADAKDRYRSLIAAAYAANGNLVEAQARLNLLGDQDTARTVALQAQRALAENRPELEARALGLLAVALGQASTSPSQAAPTLTISSSTIFTPTLTIPASPPPGTAAQTPSPRRTPTTSPTTSPTSILNTPNPTITPLPTRTATPTKGAPFVLQDSRPVCDARLGQPLIMVEAYDAAGQPVPGAEVIVQWEGNEDHFFTGLKPEMGLGYADFGMTPGVTYSLHLAEGGQPVPNLTSNECGTSSGDRFWGSWRLVFVQP